MVALESRENHALSHRRASLVSMALGASAVVGLAVLLVTPTAGQGPSLTLLSADGRRTLPLAILNEREFVALDDLASAFGLTVREEARAITIATRGGTIVLNPSQPLASVAGRLITLPAAPARSNGRIVVPLEFIPRALAPVYDTTLDLRRESRLLVIGPLRVPRVVIGQEPLTNAARLTVDTTPPTASTVAQDGERLTLRFDADAIDLALPGTLPTGFVRGIRALDAVTLAIDLGPRFAAYRAAPPAPGNGRRTLDLLSLTADAGPPIAPTPTPTPNAAGGLALFGDRDAPFRTVVIDPGHGGEDTGVRGGGTAEKDVTLAVAKRLQALLEGRLGIRVLLTRDDDRVVPIERRTAVANNNKADVFLSLHVNGSPRPSATGASVRMATFDERERSRARLAAERLPFIGGGTRELDLVLWDVAQVRHLDRSAELAEMVARQLRTRVPMDRRAIARAPLRVLESADMPAVIVELGYLTSGSQAQQLASDPFQVTLALALFDAVVEFRDRLVAARGAR